MATLTLRPNADVSGFVPAGQPTDNGAGNYWDVLVNDAFAPGAAGWSALDDPVGQPSAADSTDRIQYAGGAARTAVLDLQTATIPSGEVTQTVTLWFSWFAAQQGNAASSRSLAAALQRADGSTLATQTWTNAASNTAYRWTSVTYSGQLTQAEVDGLRIAFTGTNSFDTIAIPVAYVEIITVASSALATLRPNRDISGFSPPGQAADAGTGTWDVNVNSAYLAGAAGWPTVDDVVSQPTAPDSTDSISANGGNNSATAIVDLSTYAIPNGQVVQSVTAWFFKYLTNGATATNTHTLTGQIRKADGTVLASVSDNGSGQTNGPANGRWVSCTYTGPLTQAELDGLCLGCVGVTSLERLFVSAMYATVQTGVPVQAGVSMTLSAGQQVVTYNQAGTFQFVVPSGVYQIKAEVYGGGAGGGGGSVGQGGGGSGGMYSRVDVLAVTPGQVVTVVVGAGGTAGASGANGANGGDSYILNTATLLAKGGALGTAGGALGNGAPGTAPAATTGVGGTKNIGGNGAVSGGGGGAGSTGAGGNANANAGGSGGTPDGGAGGAGNAAAAASAPGGGGGGGAALAAGNAGAIGRAKITYTEAVQMTTVASLQQDPTLAQPVAMTSVTALAQDLAFAEALALMTAAVPSVSAALAEDRSLTTAAALTQLESLAEDRTLTTAAVVAVTETFAETRDLTTIAVVEKVDALAESKILTTFALPSQVEALQQIADLSSVASPSQNWRLVASGLSGVARDSTGIPMSGVEVQLQRDDTREIVAVLTTGDGGTWYTALDGRFTYRALYWIEGPGPTPDDDLSWATPKHIPTVDTVIATGT